MGGQGVAGASMRPPHCAGEILRGSPETARPCAGFNEAPALRGGNRHEAFDSAIASWAASMRPPHCAGEITPTASSRPSSSTGFNEAPALRGGNRQSRQGGCQCPSGCFNEAPALRGGNRRDGRRHAGLRDEASMRPPHCAGEIPHAQEPANRRIDHASMRPPHCAGEIRGAVLMACCSHPWASMRPPHCARGKSRRPP